jgi:conjugal transfer pilus assembly protein TraB
VSNIKDWWDEQPPERRRVLSTALYASIFLLTVYAIVRGPDTGPVKTVDQGVETNMLTGAPAKELGYDALVNRQVDTEKALKKLNTTISGLKDLIDKSRKESGNEIASINNKLGQFTEQTQESLSRAMKEQSSKLSKMQKDAQLRRFKANENETIQRAIPKDQIEALFDQEIEKTSRGDREKSSVSELQVYGEQVAEEVVEEDIEEESLFLPAGSIIQGVMLNGVDAATSGKSRKDPMPVLVRVKHEAFLPNKFKMDVKECHSILGAFGDLSTERAFMRGETFTCIREDGGIIEVSLDTYAVGEDGKVGVRGRLVSRSGSLIAKSMAAGFLSQLSQVYRPTAVTGLNTSPNDETLFQQPDVGEATNAAAFAGSADAMERLADYFIDMAEQIFPVIEVDVGRKIDMVVKKGTWLRIKKL